MKRHVAEVHLKLKNHMCKTCGKCFARLEKLRAHEVVHQPAGDNRPFLCHQCGRGFGRQEHVARHQKICGQKHVKRLAVLGTDPEREPRKEILKLMYQLGFHSLQKDAASGMFACPECGSQFKCKRYVAEHYARTHRVENLKLPYRCEECGRGFKVMKDLIRHSKKPYVHKESYMAKAFVCEEVGCGRRFRREFELKRHIRIHAGIRDYKCDLCDSAFHLKQCLKTHLKTMHSVDMPKEPRRRPRPKVEAADCVADAISAAVAEAIGAASKAKRPRKKRAKKQSMSEEQTPGQVPVNTDFETGLELCAESKVSTAINLSHSGSASAVINEAWNTQGYFPSIPQGKNASAV
jgi:hypothetical protein